MNTDPERLADYLGHIVAATGRVHRYVGAVDLDDFLANELLQDAVSRNLEVIGEASRRIETRFPDFALAHSELPLAAAYQMRNAIAHGYHKVDLAVAWRTVMNDLPRLQANVQAALIGLALNP